RSLSGVESPEKSPHVKSKPHYVKFHKRLVEEDDQPCGGFPVVLIQKVVQELIGAERGTAGAGGKHVEARFDHRVHRVVAIIAHSSAEAVLTMCEADG